jgi:hypothetical protein
MLPSLNRCERLQREVADEKATKYSDGHGDCVDRARFRVRSVGRVEGFAG